VILKVNYLAVHTDNYQGGAGKAYSHSIYIDIGTGSTCEYALNEAQKVLESKTTGYPIENIKILSAELIKTEALLKSTPNEN